MWAERHGVSVLCADKGQTALEAGCVCGICHREVRTVCPTSMEDMLANPGDAWCLGGLDAQTPALDAQGLNSAAQVPSARRANQPVPAQGQDP